MSQSARKKMRRKTHSPRSLWRVIRLTAICSFVGLSVLTIGIALAESGQVHFGRHSQTADTCTPTLVPDGNAGQPAKWFSINSGSTADILSAVKCTDMYQSASQGSDLIAQALQAGTLATPVLVKPYRNNVGLSQFWVVPVLDANNHPLALLAFFYNPQTKLIHEGEFDAVTGDMFYVNRTFPAVTANASVSVVSNQQHMTTAQGRTPELIYFPADRIGLQTGKVHWQAGGASVIDPIWRVPGTDGKWHYVDHDGHAHMNTDLPVDPSYQAMPSTTTTQ